MMIEVQNKREKAINKPKTRRSAKNEEDSGGRGGWDGVRA